MKKLITLTALVLFAGCSSTPTSTPAAVAPAGNAAPKLDAAAFSKTPKLSSEQLKQKNHGCDKGSVQDCADLVRFNGKSALGEAFAKDTRRLCALDQVECQLNQKPFPRKKSRENSHSGGLIASWATQYQDEDGPHSFVYKIYQ
jgi:hypothetical protein